MLSQESPTRWPVFSLENKASRAIKTHRYHRNEATQLYLSEGYPKGLPYVPGPMIGGTPEPTPDRGGPTPRGIEAEAGGARGKPKATEITLRFPLAVSL